VKEVDALLAKMAGQAGDEALDTLKELLGVGKCMEEVAAMAAPYCHPRQGVAAEDDGGEERIIPLAERLKSYQRRDEIDAAEGELKH
jgi:hypothetical protein